MRGFTGRLKKKEDKFPPESILLPSEDVSIKEYKHFSIKYSNLSSTSFLETQDLIIVLEGFISNFESLKKFFSLKSSRDVELISDLFHLDHFNFQNSLLGNFSISIFNKTNQELMLIRDHFGSIPIFYMDDSNSLVFSTEISSLLAIDEIKFNVDKYNLIDFLSLREMDLERTFFKEVKKIRPSHTLKMLKSKKSIDLYNYKGDSKKIRTNDENLVLEFTELLENSIKSSSDNKTRVGVMLSGGLDSSAITLGIKNSGFADVHTFSGNFTHLDSAEKELADETNFQQIVANKTGFKHNHISLNGVSPLKAIKEFIPVFCEPFHMPNLYLFKEIAEKASMEKIKVMYDGQDGDNVISHGFERFFELLCQLKLLTLIREVLLYAKFNQIKLKNLIKFLFSHLLLKTRINLRKRVNNTLLKDEIFFDKEFYKHANNSIFDSHKSKLENSMHVTAFEQRRLVFGNYGIENRSPFYSKELINFCISLPSSWKLRKGKGRYILREYLRSGFSKEIYLRNKKANLSYGLLKNLDKEDLKEIEKEVKDINPVLMDLVEQKKLEKIISKDSLDDRDLMNLFSFYITNRWLKSMAGKIQD
tara:strand:- start:2990 stop:4759 length:1770 start_codon:yes stop_codon:yes gene_type:complete